MTPPLAIGLAIVLNMVILVGGVAWLRRQVKRVAAERAARFSRPDNGRTKV